MVTAGDDTPRTRRKTRPMPKLIDRIAPDCDVAESHVVHTTAPPDIVVEAIGRLDPHHSPIAGLDRVEVDPVPLVHDEGRERVHRAAWQPDADRPGVVIVVWDLRVESDGEDGSFVSTTWRFKATTPAARDHLLTAVARRSVEGVPCERLDELALLVSEVREQRVRQQVDRSLDATHPAGLG